MEFSNCYGCRVKNLASTQATASLPWHYFNPSQITFLVFKMKDFEKQDPSVCPPGKYACSAKSLARFAPIEVIRIFFLLEESGILDFGIRDSTQGIRNPANVWNPESPAGNLVCKTVLD